MPSNFFSPITTTVQQITTAVALVTPQTNGGYQPQNTNGRQPPALLFHYEGENVATMQSDITDHFIEDNTAIQDQIALRPEKVTVNGFIGELNNVFPVGVPNNGQITASLAIVDAFVPGFTSAGQQLINTAFAAYQTVQALESSAVSAWGVLSGAQSQTVIGSSGIVKQGSSQGLQQAVFQQFYLYWRSRVLFTVQTPWAVFTNMAIEELRATQDELTRMITDFHVTFKMLRFATSFLETPAQFNGVGRANITSINLGQSTPTSSITMAAGLGALTGTPAPF